MQDKNQELLFEQYKNYNYSKEQFINRSFATNRFYMVLCLVLLLVSYILMTFTPASASVLIASFLGILLSILWWLNVDTYNILIKIKYNKVLEKIEKQLPALPFNDEFRAFQEVKSQKSTFVFSDVQKIFASLMFLVFLITIFMQVYMLLKFYMPRNFQ